MTALPVIYSPPAERQLAELRRYIEANSGATRAATYVDAVIDYCDGLTTFPKRGARRDDILPGLRIIGYRRRVTVAFTIEPLGVIVQGVFYGGQDYEAAFRDEPE